MANDKKKGAASAAGRVVMRVVHLADTVLFGTLAGRALIVAALLALGAPAELASTGGETINRVLDAMTPGA